MQRFGSVWLRVRIMLSPDELRDRLARALLSAASRLLQGKIACNGKEGWYFDNNWSQPVRRDAATDRCFYPRCDCPDAQLCNKPDSPVGEFTDGA